MLYIFSYITNLTGNSLNWLSHGHQFLGKIISKYIFYNLNSSWQNNLFTNDVEIFTFGYLYESL